MPVDADGNLIDADLDPSLPVPPLSTLPEDTIPGWSETASEPCWIPIKPQSLN